jgi:hypothetical protein
MAAFLPSAVPLRPPGAKATAKALLSVAFVTLVTLWDVPTETRR